MRIEAYTMCASHVSDDTMASVPRTRLRYTCPPDRMLLYSVWCSNFVYSSGASCPGDTRHANGHDPSFRMEEEKQVNTMGVSAGRPSTIKDVPGQYGRIPQKGDELYSSPGKQTCRRADHLLHAGQFRVFTLLA